MRDLAEYQFMIPGACPPKGSRVPVRPGSDKTRESSKRVEPWTNEAIRCMRDRLGKPRASFSGPVYVEALFIFKRPKVTEFEFPTATTIGDLDKLLRCLNDALTKAGVIEDDRFIVEFPGPPRKIWGSSDMTVCRVGNVQPPGVEVTSLDRADREFVAGMHRPAERCSCTEVFGMPAGMHYHNGDGAGICWCLRANCTGCVPNPYESPCRHCKPSCPGCLGV